MQQRIKHLSNKQIVNTFGFLNELFLSGKQFNLKLGYKLTNLHKNLLIHVKQFELSCEKLVSDLGGKEAIDSNPELLKTFEKEMELIFSIVKEVSYNPILLIDLEGSSEAAPLYFFTILEPFISE